MLLISFHLPLPPPALPLAPECHPNIMDEKQAPSKDPDPDLLSPADSAVTDLSPNSESCPKTDTSVRTEGPTPTPNTSPQPKKGKSELGAVVTDRGGG